MDSFGFDFAGGDLLDLGSLGSWTNSAPIGNSPNGGGGALPFSVGTPTGVQSLGDDPFASMPSGGDNDFSFGDSPKPSPQSHKPADNAPPPTSSDMGSSYFGSELEPSAASSATPATTSSTSTTDADKKKNEDVKPKPEAGAPASASAPGSGSSSNSTTTSSAATSSASAPMKSDATSSSTATSTAASSATTSAKPSPSSASTSQAQAASSSGAASSAGNASSSNATTSAPSTTSSARPHIGNQQQQQQQQQMQMQQQRQQQYANQMMMNQQNGQPQQFAGQSYQQQMHAGQMPAGVSGAPPTSAAGQYMGGQPGQAYRPPTSSYEEEFARVKAMMMQHPDLIPPPMEVLRISMSQSAANQQNMAMGANAYMQRGNPAMARGGAPGSAAYGQYGTPNMMMGGPQQNVQQAGMMNAARMRAAQMAQQQAQHRAAAGRTPSGSNPGDTQTAWQSENDLPLRRKMIGKIVSLLQQRKPDAPAEWIRRLPDMARRLEDSLYRTAKNRDEYGDFSSLKTRLQHLAVTMGARAQHKAGGSDDLQGDGSSSLNDDAMKNGGNDPAHLVGTKRTLSQSQQQMAAAANAAAFKRTKVGAAGQAAGQLGAAPNQPHPGNSTSGPQASQPSQTSMQKPVTSRHSGDGGSERRRNG
ncbi:hypothetical protein PF011_g2199 [Phytophthora fragariae]|uniref:Mediator complex subunit 15 KIX domain-containing protein n=1 Tax=Phytophthora fragariae TaxID=53985 RepID=A0A6A3MA68_9STRA|nr:hypothetical protein PF011_g2199 [Phytophthora fragariae]